MLKKASAYSGILKQQGLWKYRKPSEVPDEKRGLFKYLTYNTNILWQRAEQLGWQPQPAESDRQYMERVKQLK